MKYGNRRDGIPRCRYSASLTQVRLWTGLASGPCLELGWVRHRAQALPDLLLGVSDMSVRWVFLHMIEEYARHNGHADLIRERIDGRTGD
jgi:Protein of unknown function (DUF664)